MGVTAVGQDPATPTITAATRITSPRMTIMELPLIYTVDLQ